MAAPDAVLLFAMRRADARIHVKQDTSRWTATMNAVDPFAGEISKRRKALFRREPARLKAAHLARRSRCPQSRLSADDPPHRGIMALQRSIRRRKPPDARKIERSLSSSARVALHHGLRIAFVGELTRGIIGTIPATCCGSRGPQK